jgi:hypothetical protein
MAGTTGLEPATSAVTGQRSNQLSYVPKRNTFEVLGDNKIIDFVQLLILGLLIIARIRFISFEIESSQQQYEFIRSESFLVTPNAFLLFIFRYFGAYFDDLKKRLSLNPAQRLRKFRHGHACLNLLVFR